MLRSEQYGKLVEALVVNSAGDTSKVFILGDEYGSLQTIDAIHAAVHRGRLFTHSNIHLNVAVDSFVDHLFHVSSAAEPHFRLGGVSVEGAPFYVQFFEDAQVSSLGAESQLRNNNRRFPDTNGMSIHEAAVVTSTGAELFAQLIPGTSQGGGEGDFANQEWVLRGGLNYLLRITNKSVQAQDMSLTQTWYEL